jgi:hypothetical protein
MAVPTKKQYEEMRRKRVKVSCMNCKRLNQRTNTSCEAFKWIPVFFTSGEFQHDKSVKGDGGKFFEPSPEALDRAGPPYDEFVRAMK